MDALGSYDSDDEVVPPTSPSRGGSKKKGSKQASGKGVTSKGTTSKGTAPKATPKSPKGGDPKGAASAPGGRSTSSTPARSSPTPSQSSHKHADAATMNLDVFDCAESLSSRIHSSYYRSNVEQPSGVQGGSPPPKSDTKPGESLALPCASNGAVLAVHLGTRHTSSGELCVSGADADSATCAVPPDVSEKEAARLEAVSHARMKSRLREHTRNASDMVLANYPVDHPMHKSMSVVAKNALESYGKVGKNFMVLDAESVGGVFVTPCGMTEKTYYDEVSFEEQLRLGDLQVALAHQSAGDTKRRRRLSASEVDHDSVFGPWVPYEEGELPVADTQCVEASTPASSSPKSKLPTFEANTRKMSHVGLAFPSCAPDVAADLNEVVVEDGKQQTKYDGLVVSTFHKKVEADGPAGRSWLLPPKNLKVVDPDSYKSFLPKQEVHTYTGHTMAVQAIRYLPRTGHCLLSASMDGFVKIWDANNNRRCLRTYKGHCKGVRDIAFADPEGSRFYSCGFDSTVIQWDTEYGKVVGVYGLDATPFCVTVYPKDGGMFIVGGSNKKACQFDARTGKLSLEYSAHQSNVNTATFFEGARKLVTTGDDKRLVVWEYNIPVPIKQISDAGMHNMPAVVAHPSGKFVLGQAMSNQILVYESSGSRFRFFGGKRFKGHLCSGYAVRPTCSPDGRYVASGDARGRVYLWDWKTCRNLATLSGHKSVAMDCQWHPLQPSRLATCSWDGTIKLWD